jgi:hypothetical protein
MALSSTRLKSTPHTRGPDPCRLCAPTLSAAAEPFSRRHRLTITAELGDGKQEDVAGGSASFPKDGGWPDHTLPGKRLDRQLLQGDGGE